ncbi:MAG: molybdate ABC transporter substrate-binding protein [Pseudomonadota bacterium]
MTDLLHRLWLAALALVLVLAPIAAAANGNRVVVFAAASLAEALEEATAGWEAETGQSAVLSFAGSGTLAKQIERGAPAGVFLSANTAWMDYLAERDLLVPGSRDNLLGNRLVLVGAPFAGAPAVLDAAFDLGGRLGEGRLALGLTEAVPAGIYARAALESLGHWDAVRDRLAETDNVRAALALVARGEAPLGIVYASDLSGTEGIGVLATLPAESHPPIRYDAALIRGPGDADAAASLLAHLASPEAAEIFRRHGFLVPG